MLTLSIILGSIALGAAPTAVMPPAVTTGVGHQNIALGRPYTLSPAPNYPLTTDPGDSVQLTDGKYVGGGFWTEKGAVGWTLARPASITIDLGKPTAIGGAAFSTAAGRAGVQWPGGLYLFCSADGATFSYLGDLVSLDRARGAVLPENGFARHRFETHALSAQCRFVRIMVDAVVGPYVFVDEVELYGDSSGAARAPTNGEPDGPTLYWRARLRGTVDETVREARLRLSTATVDAEARASAGARLEELERRIAMSGPDAWSSASDTYPINDLHTGVLAVIGSLEQLGGAPLLRAWAANPWDPLTMTSGPSAGTGPAISVAMMNGEVRAAAVNVRNSSGQPLQVSVDVSVDGKSRPAWIEVRTVAWTGDAEGQPVATALQALKPEPGPTFSLPAGATSQVWLSFAPESMAAGIHRGAVALAAPGTAAVRVPVQLEILGGQMPARRRLHVGGWDYLNRNGGTPGSADYLREIAVTLDAYGVDLPWATSGAMPFGRYDAQGRMTELPDTSAFDAWLALWPNAARYRVFVSAGDRLARLSRGTIAFQEAVKAWAQFWAAHVADKGIAPGRVDLLFVDEPYQQDLAERQIAWARALEASGSGLQVWLDPTYANADQTPEELVGSANTVCVNRRLAERSGEPYRAFARRLEAAGKTVEIYGTDGPTTKLDPYAYYRLQAWRAFDVGAVAVSFWSFTDTGKGSSSWREYQAPGTIYSPLFLDGSSVVASKHLAAIREGVEDYEYLAMLRDAISNEAARRRPDDQALTRARAVLSSAVRRVLGSSGVADYPWITVKDRSVADAARIEIAEELQRLSAAPRHAR